MRSLSLPFSLFVTLTAPCFSPDFLPHSGSFVSLRAWIYPLLLSCVLSLAFLFAHPHSVPSIPSLHTIRPLALRMRLLSVR